MTLAARGVGSNRRLLYSLLALSVIAEQAIPSVASSIIYDGSSVRASPSLSAVGSAPVAPEPPPFLLKAPALGVVVENGTAVSPVVTGDGPRHLMGTYRSEETNDWAQVYYPNATLGPLHLTTNRFQISLQDAELAADGTFVDPLSTQLGVLKAIAASVSTDILVTVGYPWTNASREYISNGFSEGWWDYWWRTFASLADKLASPEYDVGKPLIIELMGEPDLSMWSWVYGNDTRRIYETIWLAYTAFDRHRDKFRVGGCGFALLDTTWAAGFVDYALYTNISFDFWSFHSYLGWNSTYDPSQYPSMGFHYNLGAVTAGFQDTLAARGLRNASLILSEYAWQDGDLAASAGFGDSSKDARAAMADWRNGARSLTGIQLAMAEPSISHAYWAQGVGTVAGTPDMPYIYAYDPAVVWDSRINAYRYKSSYYAFWMYGKLEGSSVQASVPDPVVGLWATYNAAEGIVRVVLWNKSPAGRPVQLTLPGVGGSAACTMYRVDSETFVLSASGLEAIVASPLSPTPPVEASVSTYGQALQYLDGGPGLGGEATVMLEIGGLAPPTQPGKAPAAAVVVEPVVLDPAPFRKIGV